MKTKDKIIDELTVTNLLIKKNPVVFRLEHHGLTGSPAHPR